MITPEHKAAVKRARNKAKRASVELAKLDPGKTYRSNIMENKCAYCASHPVLTCPHNVYGSLTKNGFDMRGVPRVGPYSHIYEP